MRMSSRPLAKGSRVPPWQCLSWCFDEGPCADAMYSFMRAKLEGPMGLWMRWIPGFMAIDMLLDGVGKEEQKRRGRREARRRACLQMPLANGGIYIKISL